jgi:mRNA interferase YafQ
MRSIKTTRSFERDIKKAAKRGKDLDKLWRVVDRLSRGEPLSARHRRHRLSGEWSRFWECHIEPDWLLIWDETETAVILVRTGTHADLFG